MLYRFQIELSDVDRGIYESLDFRISQHPSEISAYLLSRSLAYALSYQPGIEFSPSGLSDPEAPALRVIGKNGSVDLWIEIGNPSARKLHKAGKLAKQVVIYTYKSAEILISDIDANAVHRADELVVYAFDSAFLNQLELMLEKNNRWSLLFQDGQIDLSTPEKSISASVKKYKSGISK